MSFSDQDKPTQLVGRIKELVMNSPQNQQIQEALYNLMQHVNENMDKTQVSKEVIDLQARIKKILQELIKEKQQTMLLRQERTQLIREKDEALASVGKCQVDMEKLKKQFEQNVVFGERTSIL